SLLGLRLLGLGLLAGLRGVGRLLRCRGLRRRTLRLAIPLGSSLLLGRRRFLLGHCILADDSSWDKARRTARTDNPVWRTIASMPHAPAAIASRTFAAVWSSSPGAGY